MTTDDTQINYSLDIIKAHWDKNTLEALPVDVKENNDFKKKLNYLKLINGAMPIGTELDDEYFIVSDIKGNRTRIRSLSDRKYEVGDKSYWIICSMSGIKSIIQIKK